ncbi:transcriptional regulator [Enterococcus olivae]
MELNDVHEVFFSKLRLSIISHLISKNLYFSELKQLTQATDGNLSVQLKKLESWQYITSEKRLHQGKAVTEYALTNKGQKEFRTYIELLESFLN